MHLKNIKLLFHSKFLFVILLLIFIFSCFGVYHYSNYKNKQNYENKTNQLNIIIEKLEKEKTNKESTISEQESKLKQQQQLINEKDKELSTLKKNIISLENNKRIPVISRGSNAMNVEYLGSFRVTFYTPYEGSVKGITATGVKAKPGKTVAVDPKIIPLGTKLFIEGFGEVIAEDVGGRIVNNSIDYCVDSRKTARELGVKKLKVWVIK